MKRRSGLGRGLDSLIPARDDDEAEARGGMRRVGPDLIDANPSQPRETFSQDELDELTHSISTFGVLQPLLVRESSGGRYELIAGERRLRAARQAGLDDVPVMVIETDDRGSLERALVENLHRSDLDPVEEAEAYRQLIEAGGLTQEALAERLGRNRVTISNALRLLDLPDAVKRLLVDRRLTAGHGKALLGLEGNPFLERLARRAADEKLSVRETEELVRKYQSMTPSATTGSRGRSQPPEVTEVQRALADHLQTRVRVEMGKRKGRIVLDFVTVDELERLSEVILGRAEGAQVTRVTPD
ncbi:MAG: ParB/RepB/Spo0J family partition protein [Actinomycetota bacterium]